MMMSILLRGRTVSVSQVRGLTGISISRVKLTSVPFTTLSNVFGAKPLVSVPEPSCSSLMLLIMFVAG